MNLNTEVAKPFFAKSLRTCTVSSRFDVPIDNFSQSTIFEEKLGHSYSFSIMNCIFWDARASLLGKY